MIKGIYTAAMALVPLQSKLDITANNVANAETTGFKRDITFDRAFIDANLTLKRAQGNLNTTETFERTSTDFSQGSLSQTKNPFDLAISGRGFFAIDTPQGVRYSRAGHFTLSSDGTLVTPDGNAVLGESGRIQFPDPKRLQETDVRISDEGEISMAGVPGKTKDVIVGKLQLTDFDRYASLRKEGSSLYSIAGTVTMTPVDPQLGVVKQGYLEDSNVNVVEEMTSLIDLMRQFQQGQKAVQTMDQSLERVTDVGRI